jgi:D-alanyl-D-alanine dipeptidase
MLRSQCSLPALTFRGIGAALLSLAAVAQVLAADRPNGVVRLAGIDPSIRQDIRYAGPLNFLGRPANGYEALVCILREPAATALTATQKKLAAQGLTLIVIDCYRPATATADFVA